MPAVQSKDVKGETEEEAVEARRAEQRKLVDMLLKHIALNVAALTFPIQVSPQVCSECYGRDFVQGGKFMGLLSSGIALFGAAVLWNRSL